MARTLLLFLFSKRVDPYVNAIAHTYDKLGIGSVRLIHVRGAKTALSDSEASALSNQIWSEIESLSKGEYIDFSAGSLEGVSAVSLPRRQVNQSSRIDVYRRINEQLLDRRLVPLMYSDLKEGLELILKDCGGAQNCIVDLTAASKVPGIDIFSICLALGVQFMFTFELSDRPDPRKPEESLYHSLAPDAYGYTCLAESPAVKATQRALLRKEQLLWYVVVAALLVMLASLYVYFVAGAQSVPLQILNLLAAVVGIITPLFALVSQRGKG
jgi:hypothetical protein